MITVSAVHDNGEFWNVETNVAEFTMEKNAGVWGFAEDDNFEHTESASKALGVNADKFWDVVSPILDAAVNPQEQQAATEAYDAGAEYALQIASDMQAHQHGPNTMTEFHDIPAPDERALRAKYPGCDAIIDKAFRRGYNDASADWYAEHGGSPADVA